MLRSGLVAAAESVRAEIGRGREDVGLLAGIEGTDALGWCVWRFAIADWTTETDEGRGRATTLTLGGGAHCSFH
jgi:hypothetical protein